MPISGSQDFWVVGSRAYFKKTGLNPWRDLGIIQTVSPNITTESIELEDPDGGLKTTADKQVTKIAENYDLTLSNLSMKNLSMMFLGEDPTTLSVTAAENTFVSSLTYKGELLQLTDSSSEPIRLTQIAGVYTGTVTTGTGDCTAIDVSTGRITTASSYVSSSAGDQIIIHPDGLADKRNAGTYTIVGTPSATVISVSEPFLGADETAVTVDLTIANAGTVYKTTTDWTPYSHDRGLLSFVDGGAMAASSTAVTVIYWQYAISGDRLIIPQSASSIEGELRVIFSRDTFGSETERYIPKVKVQPGAASFSTDDYSNFVLNFEVTSDTTKTNQVGHMKHYKGAIPSSS